MTLRLSNAVHAYRSGRLKEAEQACREALASNPKDAAALNLLGVLAATAGKHSLATKLMSDSVAIAPNDAAFRRNLVTTCLARGDLATAEQAILAVAPQGRIASEFLLAWGEIQLRRGQFAEAIRALKVAVSKFPESVTAHYNLAEAYRRSGDQAAALIHFHETTRLDSSHPNALNNMAGVYLSQCEYKQAIRCIELLLKTGAKSCQTYCNLGVSLKAVGDIDQATLAFETAAKLDPCAVSPRLHLASLHIGMGNLDACERLLLDVAELEPESPKLRAARACLLERQGSLSEAAKLLEDAPAEQRGIPQIAMATATIWEQQGKDREAVELVESLISRGEMSSDLQWSSQFLLGRCYDKLGCYDDAYKSFQIANSTKKATLAKSYSKQDRERIVNRLRASWKEETLEPGVAGSEPSARPIFIVGMPRSGTSLVEQILDCHPTAHGCGELQLLGNLIRTSESEAIPQNPSTTEDIFRIQRDYTRQVSQGLPQGVRTIDKQPYNFHYLGWIRAAFPHATILHCRRDPRDTCLSAYFTDFFEGNEHTYDLSDLGSYYRSYVAIMQHWNSIGIDLFDVSYEALVTDPDREVHRLLDHCGLAWHDDCLRFYDSNRTVHTASYQQVRKPIYKASVHRWRNYHDHLGPLVSALGKRC